MIPLTKFQDANKKSQTNLKIQITNCKDPKYPENTIPALEIFQAIKHSSVIANSPDT
jgi:hypothetical protein